MLSMCCVGCCDAHSAAALRSLRGELGERLRALRQTITQLDEAIAAAKRGDEGSSPVAQLGERLKSAHEERLEVEARLGIMGGASGDSGTSSSGSSELIQLDTPDRFGLVMRYSDDTELSRELLLSTAEVFGAMDVRKCIAESQGNVVGEHIAEKFAKRILDLHSQGNFHGGGRTSLSALTQLRMGISWRDSGGSFVRASNGSAMRASPVGLMFYSSPPSVVAQIAALQSHVTHQDPQSKSGAAAIALAVSQCIQCALSNAEIDPQAFMRNIQAECVGIDPGCRFAEAVSSMLNAKTVDQAHSMLPPTPPTYISSSVNWPISTFVTPTVLWALYSFLRTPHCFAQTLAASIRPGGDADTVAAIACAISGAYNGYRRIFDCGSLQSWISRVADRANTQRNLSELITLAQSSANAAYIS
ncbi:ADP-ribosylglycohydrolase family protein [Pelomyxa schiedti]|nr:ADP-ribosylglycohydrolase family protein [Pelomyxa schiedti]